MTTIWKFPLQIEGVQTISMPLGAKVLCVHTQFEQPYLWAQCDPSAKKVDRKVAIVGTGHAAPDDGVYVGTFQLRGGSLVFHVFLEAS